MSSQDRSILSVIVQDQPGVLARVSSLLARRGFNIHSLTVGHSHEDGLSRMTVVVDAPEVEQVKKQLHKLINVVKISELSRSQSIERELVLVRVSASTGRRSEVLEIASLFKAKAVDVGHTTVTFQFTAAPDKVSDFLELVRPFGIVDLVRSGWIAMGRDPKPRHQERLRAV